MGYISEAKETQLNRAKKNADALNDSLCSLEQNNYMDAEYLMLIIRQQITNIQNSLILLS